jgi:hypothetical protein
MNKSTRASEPADIKPDVSVSRSLPTEFSLAAHQSRLKRLEADARARRWLSLLPTMMVVLLVLCALAVYVTVLLSGGYGEEDKERAEKILTPIIACLLGYVGGSSKGKD